MNATDPDPTKFYFQKEAAIILGVSIYTMRRAMNEGKIPYDITRRRRLIPGRWLKRKVEQPFDL
jgi:predicted site-specific integrase-resolvase